MKDKLLVSFSSGETSAYMSLWLKENRSDQYDMIFVMANTGEENEESLVFAENCNQYFGLNLVIVESVVHYGERKGCTHRIVNFETANRNGKPFEDVIKKYGIPNQAFPHCTRELKANPIKSYANSLGWDNYYTAIGIRSDEIDRMSVKRKERKYIYPLIELHPMTKPQINEFWENMPFRLEGERGTLKGWDDNCKTCWKKSLRKLLAIAKENPEKYQNFKKWEDKYERFIPGGRKKNDNGEPLRFFRKGLSVEDIMQLSKEPFEMPKDDRIILPKYENNELSGHHLDKTGDCFGSCEPFK